MCRYDVNYNYISFLNNFTCLAFQLNLAKIQREITDRIKSRESEMQALKQAIEDFQVYLCIYS